MYAVVSLVGAAVFIIVYGVRILEPTYVDWLMKGTDLTQHYIGWRAYRDSSWHFPIGMIDNLSYPNDISVIFTDSIPIFAVLFKMLSPILPSNFQYFGIWGLLCFVLQIVVAYKILSGYIRDKISLLLSSVLFLFVPVIFQRMYYHSALAGHWVILLGFAIFFSIAKNDFVFGKKIYIEIAILAIVSSGVHMYFVLMNAMIAVGVTVLLAIKKTNILKCIGVILLYVVIAVLNIALLGGFSGKAGATQEGLGEYALNLIGFINPEGNYEGVARILNPMPVLAMWADEGYAYLGMGVIILLCLSVGVVIINKKIRSWIRDNIRAVTVFLLVNLVAFVFAVSPRIALGRIELVNIPLPSILYNIWSIFRATGRLSWIIIYSVILCSAIIVCKGLKKWLVYAILSVCLIIQVFDMSDIIATKHEKYANKQVFVTPLCDSVWEEITYGKNHVVLMSDFNIFEKFYIADWALNNSLTTNDFYFARTNEQMIEKSRQNALNNSEEVLFVFSEADRENCQKYNLNYTEANGFIIGYK